ncbi:MAG: type II toxin-antitoxin system VapC family toxin [Alphaproteobacteria bacterium]|nr:type II toxin-antitoxin system VapC family toxin [Alphaproteobacteria bacterium]
MQYYLDTSFIGSVLRHDANSQPAQRWLDEHAEADLWTSDWTRVEFAGAMARRARMGDITPEMSRILFAAFLAAREHLFTMTEPPTSEDYDSAALDTLRQETGLRPGDALQIAIARKLAQSHGDTTLITFDIKLAKAAPDFGLPAVIPG